MKCYWLADLIGDARYGARALRRNGTFAAAAILTLAIGIGANTAVFSVASAVLLKPLPYPHADRIVMLMSAWRGRDSVPGVSAPKFTVWRQSTDVFEDAAAYRIGGAMNLTDSTAPEQLAVAHVSAEFFRLFNVPMALGRTFSSQEDHRNDAQLAVISHGFWQRHMGGDPEVSGRTISLDGTPHEIIGVVDRDFNPQPLSLSNAPRPDVWLPLRLDANSQSDAPFLAAARLRADVPLEIAQAQTDRATVAVRQALPAVMPIDAGLSVQPLHTVLVRGVRPALLVLLGAVVVVLLIACTNTANLLLVRGSVRQREIAIRLATGASRARIVRQMITESLVLSCTGGVFGFLLALVGVQALTILPVGTIPLIADITALTMDWRVLLFTVIASMLAGVAFGLAPAFVSTRIDIEAVLKAGAGRTVAGPTQRKLRTLLVIAEMAFALMLLVASALLIRSFVNLRNVDAGIVTSGVVTLQVALTGEQFATTGGTTAVVGNALQRIRSAPGIDSAAATLTGVPLSGGASFLNITIPGRTLEGPYFGGGYLGGWHVVSSDYFDVFKMRLLAGRAFSEHDDQDSVPVVIVNEAMVRQLWPNENPLDRQLLIGLGAGPDFEETTPRRIVGVVNDVRHVGLEWNPRPTAYVPLTQLTRGQLAFFNRVGGRLTWVVRTTGGDPHAMAKLIEHELRQGIGQLPIAAVRSMEDVSTSSSARREFNMWLMISFGGSALLLAAVGVSGVVAHTVRQRTREIGIRLALGAEPHRIGMMILGQGMTPVVIGIATGIIGASGLARLMSGLLFGIEPHDAIVFVTAPLVLSLVAVVAMWLPARRSTVVDPSTALRHE